MEQYGDVDAYNDKEMLDITKSDYYELKRKYKIIPVEHKNLKSEIDELRLKFDELSEYFHRLRKDLNAIKNHSAIGHF